MKSQLTALFSLLGTTAAAAVAAVAHQTDYRKLQDDDKSKVLVLGAGMSGLTAALALKDQGHDVHVLEVQNRIGGRVWSKELKNSQFTELGAGHVRSNMPNVMATIHHYGLPTIAMNDGLPLYMDGNRTGYASLLDFDDWDLQENETDANVPTLLNYYLSLNGLDTETVLDPDWPSPEEIERFDPFTLRELLKISGASDAYIDLLNAHGGLFTADASVLSVIPDVAYHFGDQNLQRISGGNDLLPQAVAEDIGMDKITTNAKVVKIDHTRTPIVVTIEDGIEFQADYVITTIPWKVMLEDVEVIPDWSEGKQIMFNTMDWSSTVKVVCQTPSPTWIDQGFRGWPMAGGDKVWERLIDITGNVPTENGNTFFYINGPNREDVILSGSNNMERAQFVIDSFQADVPGAIEECITLDYIDWVEVDWIKASFSDMPTNSAWMIEEWRVPEAGRIFFAGDWTTLKSGWIEGAIESGIRAARGIDPNARLVFQSAEDEDVNTEDAAVAASMGGDGEDNSSGPTLMQWPPAVLLGIIFMVAV